MSGSKGGKGGKSGKVKISSLTFRYNSGYGRNSNQQTKDNAGETTSTLYPAPTAVIFGG
jgi:hypothetical protein